MRSFHAFLLILGLLAFSLQSRAETADWQQFQSQATQAYQDGNYLLAEHTIQQAIRVAEKADNGAAYKASSLNMLAYIYSAQGQVDQALQAINQAVELSRQAFGEPHEQLSQLLFNQGQLLEQASNSERARHSYQQAINDYLALNSTGDNKLWQAVLAQAHILTEEKQFTEAESVIKKALAGFPEHSQFNHQPESIEDSVDLRVLLAQIQIAQQQNKQAIELLEQVRQLLQQQSSPENERQLLVLELLATAYEDSHQQAKSTPIREQALLIRQQQTTPSLASVMHLNELALRQQLDENYEQADRFYQQALALLVELNKSDSIEQALILGNRASLKLQQQDNKAALALFEQSLLLHNRFNQRPLEASKIATYSATIYYNQRQYAKAEPLFLQALKLLDSSTYADKDSLLIALDNLAALYQSWGKPGKATAYSKRARELKNK